MTVSESSGFNLYRSMVQVHDEEVVRTLMEMLPPVGWADVATIFAAQAVLIAAMKLF